MRKIQIPEQTLRPVMGPLNEHFRTLEKFFKVRIYNRGTEVFIEGKPNSVERAERVLQQMSAMSHAGQDITSADVLTMCRIVKEDPAANLDQYFTAYRIRTSRRRTVYPKSFNQKRYIEAIRTHDIVFAIGPAGTGKTYLAMALAIEALMNRTVSRLILTRPAVEAGERLGFLPGTMLDKVHPYLRPLYDALYDLMEIERIEQLHQKGIIEIAPLAYMRGRTLNDAFIILDEAQNTTSEQMKMFLTRIGFSSKAVITGDITQIDLPSGHISGLREAIDVLGHIEDLAFVFFEPDDVVRHPLVKAIVQAYETYEAVKEQRRKTTPAKTPRVAPENES